MGALFGDAHVTDGESAQTYEETYENARERAGGLQDAGVERGERPVAIVSPAPGHDLDEEDLVANLDERVDAGQINDWWVPDDCYAVEEMPLTSTGTIQKTELRDRFE